VAQQEHLRKVLSSAIFHSSESLQRLLAYLVENSAKDSPHPVKEYQIATDVFSRGPGFDPRTDSSVRVNVARLRSKLLEYYATDGKDDPLRIEIPKGSYVTLFRRREEPPEGSGPDVAADAATHAKERAAGASRRQFAAFSAALAAGFVLGAAITAWLALGTTVFSRGGPDPVIPRFWKRFLDPAGQTVVVYSSARFVGNGETGLRYYNPALDRPEDIRTLHTGVGELVGVFELSRLFSRLGSQFDVKGAALVDWDQVKKSNVIFIGGPTENMPVRELRPTAKFVFGSYMDPDGSHRAAIFNRQPLQGEPKLFDAGTENPVRHDYAIIRSLAGFVPGRNILILAGITTLGTQAAVEFVCRPDTLQALFSRMGRDAAEPLDNFECVVEVDVHGGVPVNSKIIAFHSQGSS
jgi:hypothetical protein